MHEDFITWDPKPGPCFFLREREIIGWNVLEKFWTVQPLEYFMTFLSHLSSKELMSLHAIPCVPPRLGWVVMTGPRSAQHASQLGGYFTLGLSHPHPSLMPQLRDAQPKTHEWHTDTFWVAHTKLPYIFHLLLPLDSGVGLDPHCTQKICTQPMQPQHIPAKTSLHMIRNFQDSHSCTEGMLFYTADTALIFQRRVPVSSLLFSLDRVVGTGLQGIYPTIYDPRFQDKSIWAALCLWSSSGCLEVNFPDYRLGCTHKILLTHHLHSSGAQSGDHKMA